jgi:hypothetical protein
MHSTYYLDLVKALKPAFRKKMTALENPGHLLRILDILPKITGVFITAGENRIIKAAITCILGEFFISKIRRDHFSDDCIRVMAIRNLLVKYARLNIMRRKCRKVYTKIDNILILFNRVAAHR